VKAYTARVVAYDLTTPGMIVWVAKWLRNRLRAKAKPNPPTAVRQGIHRAAHEPVYLSSLSQETPGEVAPGQKNQEEMSKEELLKELANTDTIRWLEQRTNPVEVERLLDVLSSALDRYALSVVETCVPEEQLLAAEPRVGYAPEFYKIGFNDCRAQTLENAKRLTNSTNS
jgi:hypothetical protein